MALLKEAAALCEAGKRFRDGSSARALAISARACSTCIASIIRPSWRSAPPVAASTSRRAASSSASVGANRRLAVSIWLGMDQRLAVEAPGAALARIRPRARRRPRAGCRRRRRPGRRRRARRARSAAAHRPARRGRRRPAGRGSAARSLVPAIRPRAPPARSRRRRSPPRGVSIIASTGFAISQPASCDLLGALRLGEDDDNRPARGGPRRRPRHNAAEPAGLTRIATGRPPKPSRVASTARLARRGLVLVASPHPRGRG